MGLWNAYFIAKLFLYTRGYIAFHSLLNALLLIFLTLPWWLRARSIPRATRNAHHCLGAILALFLFWHDSYFPPFRVAFDFVWNPATRPAASYVFKFIEGLWNPWVAGALIALLVAAVWASRRRLVIAPFVLLAMAYPTAMNWSASKLDKIIDAEVAQFYATQANTEVVKFGGLAQGVPPMDILLLHVCSMSWDDLKNIGLDNHPFFSGFDLLLTQFNSVTAYSNPAALRLLRAPCGQLPHDPLWAVASQECSLMESLRQVGYATDTVFNNTGKYADGMAEQIVRLTHASAPLDLGSLPVEARNFDDSPIFSNFATLEKWLQRRQKSDSPRSALYYNTVSLHAGSYDPNDPDSHERDPIIRYKEAVHRVFSDLTRFLELLKTTNRNFLVVMVPEHGGALVGNRMQSRDLRDIPLPRITRVPVGLKLVGPRWRKSTLSQRQLHGPTSYQAIAYLIKEALEKGALLAKGVPETPFLSDNLSSRIFARSDGYYYQGKDGHWARLSEDSL
jgi:cellulose synthase operon protein YhjU